MSCYYSVLSIFYSKWHRHMLCCMWVLIVVVSGYLTGKGKVVFSFFLLHPGNFKPWIIVIGRQASWFHFNFPVSSSFKWFTGGLYNWAIQLPSSGPLSCVAPHTFALTLNALLYRKRARCNLLSDSLWSPIELQGSRAQRAPSTEGVSSLYGHHDFHRGLMRWHCHFHRFYFSH